MKCYVYFVRQGNKGPIKIGYAKDPRKRLESLQTANAEKLSLIAKIECECDKEARHVEQKLHKLFKSQHIRGEWFKGSIKMKRADDVIIREKKWYAIFKHKAAAVNYAFNRGLLHQEQANDFTAGIDVIITDEQWILLEIGGYRKSLAT